MREERSERSAGWPSSQDAAQARAQGRAGGFQFQQSLDKLPAGAYMCDADGLQALLVAIVESSDDAIVSKDLGGRILSWNSGAQRLFGYTAEEVVGRSITTLIPAELHDEETMLLARLRRGERIEHYETVRVAKDGRRLDISLTISPVRDGSGRIVAASKVARDITARKESEKALLALADQLAVQVVDLQRLQNELRQADRRKDEFLATLAHELRNPLAPIRNSLEVLRLSDDLSPAATRVREIMQRQVDHLVRLVDDLMEISRFTRGKIDLRKEPLDLVAVIRSAVETSRPVIDAGGHQLAITLAPERMTLVADPVRLAQVIANLLNNAAKYTENGGQIWLAARREGNEAVISVRDNGLGIPADVLPGIFEMFTQVNRTLNRAQGGLGIGLSLARNLVQLHGGRIEARSDGPGQGSEFIVRLPLADASEARHAPHARPTDGKQEATVTLSAG